MEAAKEMVDKRKITCVEDFNHGDLATFMENSLLMKFHTDFIWSNFPNLNVRFKTYSKTQAKLQPGLICAHR